MAFHEVRFPTSLSFGSSGGPERRTTVVTLANGFEERNTPWAQSRRRYDAGLGVRSLDDISVLIDFFEARRGRLHGFRWKDWADWRSCLPSLAISPTDQDLGVGDGATTDFQLVKVYRSGSEMVTRDIAKPVAGTVFVALNGTAATDWTVDVTTGLVTFAAAPSAGAIITAGFAFDVPVRFDTDHLGISAAAFEAGEIPDVPIMELRG